MRLLALALRLLALALLPLLLHAQLSPEREAALGAALAADYRKRVTVVEHDAARDYLGALAATFRPALPPTTPPFHFEVTLNSPHQPAQYPIAFPGGHIFVLVRSLAGAPDEPYFARSLAHAIAHRAMRQNIREASRGPTADLGAIPLIYTGGWIACDAHAPVPLGIKAQLDREESGADALAARMMEHFRVNPNFAPLQAQLRALDPPPRPPSLRRPREPRQ